MGCFRSYLMCAIFILILCSLHRLGVDYIDLYQIHWPDRSLTQLVSCRPFCCVSMHPEVLTTRSFSPYLQVCSDVW